MLWVLKRTISLRRFFWAPKHVKNFWIRKYNHFYAQNIWKSRPKGIKTITRYNFGIIYWVPSLAQHFSLINPFSQRWHVGIWMNPLAEIRIPGSNNLLKLASIFHSVPFFPPRNFSGTVFGQKWQDSIEECIYLNYLPLFYYQIKCCWCWKELSHWDGSFEHTQHMHWQITRKVIQLLCSAFVLTGVMSELYPLSTLLIWRYIKIHKYENYFGKWKNHYCYWHLD